MAGCRTNVNRLIWAGSCYWVFLLLVFVFTWRVILPGCANNKKTTTLVTNLEKIRGIVTSHIRAPNGDNGTKPGTAHPTTLPDDAEKVILLSYMRAGTTFVGSAFERNKDVFYVFEPEWALLAVTMNEYLPLKYIDGTIQDPIWIDDADETVKRTIRNYLYCNISGIDVTSLQSPFGLNGEYTRPLYRCLRFNKVKMAACLKNVTESCTSKKFRFVKTIKLRVHAIEKLLTDDPSLRIIHMIRDPRGIALSRLARGEYYRTKMTFTFGRVCAEMLRDIERVEKLPPEVAKRVLPVLYEEVAENPETMIKQIYNFTQIPYTENIHRYVKSITHAAKDKRVGLSVHRANSSQTAYIWRTKINWKLSLQIDTICERVYKKVGYLRAKSEKALRDYNISLRDPHISGSYLDKFRKLGIPP